MEAISLVYVLRLVDAEFAIADAARMQQLGEAILIDVTELTSATDGERSTADPGHPIGDAPAWLALIRFVVASIPLARATQDGRLGEAYDWMLCSLDDRPFSAFEATEEIPVSDWAARLERLLSINEPTFALFARRAFFDWATAAFLTAQQFGAPQQTLVGVAPIVLGLSRRWMEMADPELRISAVAALGRLAIWADSYPLPELTSIVVFLLDVAIESNQLPQDALVYARVILCTPIGTLSSTPPHVRAAQLLAEAAPLGPIERIQVLIAAHAVLTAVGEPSYELLQAVTAAVMQAQAATDDKLGFALLQARRFPDLLRIVVELARLGRAVEAQDLVGRWFGAPPPRRMGPVLYCAPSDDRGAVYAINGVEYIYRCDEDSTNVLAAVIAAGDRTLGTSTTVRQQMGEGSLAPAPRAFEKAEGVNEFEAELRSFYALEDFRADVTPQMLEGAALFMPHVFRHPVQALMLESLGDTYPLVASFEPPAPDRPIRRALVWTAGVFSGVMEAVAITEVLGRAGVEVDARIDVELSVRELLDLYGNQDYDLLWIIGHGAFEGVRPGHATIQLGWDREMTVTLAELIGEAVPEGNRRLLVLNLCDSGVAMQGSMPPRIGIGPLLAGKTQAVIGHLWPVRGEPSTYFGLCLHTA